MSRTIVLIDDDLQFYGQLCQQLANYDFEVHQADLADESIQSAQELAADLLIIAVDLPDKHGFALCHKAKKLLSAPVMLKTSTIPADGFQKHSRLKSHADAYVDERLLTPDKLLANIDQLIGLGEPFEVEDSHVGIEVEELEMDEIEIEDFEGGGFDADPSLAGGFHDESTKVAPSSPFLDPTLDAETDAAFAALGFDDDQPAQRFDTSDVALPEASADSEPDSPFRPQIEEVTVVASADAIELDDDDDLQAIEALIDEGAQLPDEEQLPQPAQTEVAIDEDAADEVVAGLALGSTPGYELELDDDDAAAVESSAVPVPIEVGIPEELSSQDSAVLDEVTAYGAAEDVDLDTPAPEEFNPEMIEVTTNVDELADEGMPSGEALSLESPQDQDQDQDQDQAQATDDLVEEIAEPDATPEPVIEELEENLPADEMRASEDVPAEDDLDLGLDAIAARAGEEREAASHVDASQLAELRAENDRLKRELEAAKSASAGSSSEFSREHEFLDLREKINKKEKALLDAQDRLTAKDRELLDSKDKLSQLERTHSELDEKNLQLEHEILRAKEQERSLKETLKAAEQNLASAKEAHERALSAAKEAQASELTELKARHEEELSEAASASEAEAAAALEAARAEHESKLAEVESAGQAALAAAATKLSEELEAAKVALDEAVAEQVAASEEHVAAKEAELKLALDEATADFAQQKQALADQHAGKYSRLERESEEARLEIEAKAQAALEAAKAEHEQALASAHEETARLLAEAEAAKEAALASAEQAHSAATAAAAEGHESRLREALAAAEAQRKQELEVAAQNLQSLDERRREELNAAAEEREASESELLAKASKDRSALEQEHGELRGGLEQEIADLKTALSSSRDKIEQVEHELANANTRIEEQVAALESKDQVIALRDDRVANLKGEIAELEEQNANYQEQVLKAYQKIKSDESTVGRAKKAMAIALTLLDESADLSVDTDAPEPENESVS